MWKAIFVAVVAGIPISFLAIAATEKSQDWGENLIRIGLERCAEKWSPREVELTEHSICRVKIDGQWWPEDAVKAQGGE